MLSVHMVSAFPPRGVCEYAVEHVAADDDNDLSALGGVEGCLVGARGVFSRVPLNYLICALMFVSCIRVGVVF